MLTHNGPNPVPDDSKRPDYISVPVKTAVKDMAQEDAGTEPGEPAAAASDNVDGAEILLFTTSTCPNCKVAGAMLDKAGISYTVLNAEEEKEAVEKFGVRQAPTLVLVKGDDFEMYRGVSDIKGWLTNNKI